MYNHVHNTFSCSKILENLVLADPLSVLSVDRACHKDGIPTAFHPLVHTT